MKVFVYSDWAVEVCRRSISFEVLSRPSEVPVAEEVILLLMAVPSLEEVRMQLASAMVLEDLSELLVEELIALVFDTFLPLLLLGLPKMLSVFLIEELAEVVVLMTMMKMKRLVDQQFPAV